MTKQYKLHYVYKILYLYNTFDNVDRQVYVPHILLI